MTMFEVYVTRTETTTFEVEAVSAEEAERIYLSDGEETMSRTRQVLVEGVTEKRPEGEGGN